ncbi:uncharacterized protein YxjI [Enterococcus sp. PF1-24]|uniref:LURP-one-related/scramblase family protein n=1 Tax=unclassified Enterococcus TaxID=2608891 RepID=UPI0024749C1B|nr:MULTISPECIES: LURP-one-related family protein [unclassified Enterococcus]MDH6364217.1 uncharacterized protein YxjI [Enterococcus sp. PFB1-1]MDH6401318.1 uncharacterized protein YxjI [Enterococcus sp. PF1-24]
MRKLYMKQKVFSLSERFTIKDELENDLYYIEGSFFQIPKSFQVTDVAGNEIGTVVKKTFSWMPRFFVNVQGKEEVVIQKEFTFFKDRYQITGENLAIHGDFWDKNFEVFQGNLQVARVVEKWFTWGDTYEIEILQDDLEHLLICFVVALDYVTSTERAARNNGGANAN